VSIELDTLNAFEVCLLIHFMGNDERVGGLAHSIREKNYPGPNKETLNRLHD